MNRIQVITKIYALHDKNVSILVQIYLNFNVVMLELSNSYQFQLKFFTQASFPQKLINCVQINTF